MRIDQVFHEHPDGGEGLLAMVIRINPAEAFPPGVEFYTDPSLPVQSGTISYPAGHVIQPHVHSVAKFDLFQRPREVLIVRRGRMRAHFFTTTKIPVATRIVGPGDVLLLMGGGHGFEILEDLEAYEVRFGAWSPTEKERFSL